MIEGTGMQFLKHQILIHLSYWINLIPRNCAIAELLTTCRHSGFWQNEHVFSCFTVLITVSKGSFCSYWVAAWTCATQRNIKSPNDNVRGGEGNGRSIIHE